MTATEKSIRIRDQFSPLVGSLVLLIGTSLLVKGLAGTILFWSAIFALIGIIINRLLWATGVLSACFMRKIGN